MDERQTNGDHHAEGEGTADASVSEERSDVSHTIEPDHRLKRRGWRRAAAGFFLGALLTFAVTYFWLGGGDKTIAVVNGEKITQDDFVQIAASFDGAHVLDQMIAEKLVSQKAREEGLSVSDEEYEAELAVLKEQFPNEEMFELVLEQQGMSEETFRKQIEMNLLLEKMLAPKIEVSDEEVKEYFEENKEMFGEPEKVTAKQIVLESEEAAQKARKRVISGEDFAKVAEDVSVDEQTKESGGDLGTLAKGDMAQTDPILEEEIFALSAGDISEPIEGALGLYYIVHVSDKTKAKEGTFNDQAALEITEQLKEQKMQEEAPAFIEELRQNADIENKLIPSDATPVMG